MRTPKIKEEDRTRVTHRENARLRRQVRTQRNNLLVQAKMEPMEGNSTPAKKNRKPAQTKRHVRNTSVVVEDKTKAK